MCKVCKDCVDRRVGQCYVSCTKFNKYIENKKNKKVNKRS